VCSPCRTSYSQRQGLTRHIRKAHNPNICLLCEFKWGRRYEYRNHLKMKHPGVDPDMILGKAPGPRRRATIRTENVPQQPPGLPPAVERDQQNWAESQPYSLAPPFPAGARVTSVFPHAVSPVGYNSRPVYAEQTVTMDEHECAQGSFLGLEQKVFHVSYLILILMLSGCCQPTWAHQLLHIARSTRKHHLCATLHSPLRTLTRPLTQSLRILLYSGRPDANMH
jgi:hypothetical protein